MLIFQCQRLTDAEIQQIQYLNEAEFNEKTLQKLVTKLSSKLWAMQPDNAILQYLNQHARQLSLDVPSFTNPKDKNNNSDESERHKSLSSNKRKHRTDRSDKKRKRTDVSDFKSKFADYKSKSRGSSHDKKKRSLPCSGPPGGPPGGPLVGPLV